MERSSSSSSVKNGGKQKKAKQQQKSAAPPPQQQPMPFIGRPPQIPYPPGAFPFPGGPPMGSAPDQQRFLQMQIHQQQLQLQQMQQQQQQAAHASQQQRVSPPQKLSNPVQQQQQQQLQNPFSSFTTTTTPHSSVKQSSPASGNPPPKAAKAPSPSPKRPPPPPPPTPEQVKLWLSQCDWKDKTVLVARQLMGGSSINGFLKATAAAQRIKKQRARQISSVRKRAAAEMETPPTEPPATQPTEDELRVDILNPRTVKKIRLEMQQGAQAVKAMYENIQSIMKALDPTGANVPPPIHRLAATPPKPPTSTKQKVTSTKPKTKSTPAPQTSFSPPPVILSAQGSELRKNRKHKLVKYTLDVGLSEFDATGKRIFSKKHHNLRIAEVLRFRGLRAGDYVAARLSSRDLWILARVVHDYPPLTMNPVEFLKLTSAKRDALFRDKVVVKDAEDKNAEPIAVARRVVLPLPRTYAEAAEWGTRLKKGLRIYAMYPNTTSLYPATVVDNTTYCRGDDDILVVEFDEDERDASGALPQCHIPARFTVMIPREYQNKKKVSNSGKKATAASDKANGPAVDSLLGPVNEEDFDPLVDFSK